MCVCDDMVEGMGVTYRKLGLKFDSCSLDGPYLVKHATWTGLTWSSMRLERALIGQACGLDGPYLVKHAA